jgi:hypothetical protein
LPDTALGGRLTRLEQTREGALALVLELTHSGFQLMVPMMAAAVSATAVARYIDGYSIYSARLEASGPPGNDGSIKNELGSAAREVGFGDPAASGSLDHRHRHRSLHDWTLVGSGIRRPPGP